MNVVATNLVENLSRCISAAERCHSIRLQQAVTLIEHVPGARESEVVSALIRCIGTTRLTVEMLVSDYGSHQEAAQLCSAMCTACAEVCKGEQGMEKCIEACLDCARCCQEAVD